MRLTDEAARSARVARVQVRWLDPASREADGTTESVTVGDLGGEFDEASPRLRTCYAAAYFAEVLRGDGQHREVRLAELATIARRAAEETGDREVRDLAQIIDRARDLD